LQKCRREKRDSQAAGGLKNLTTENAENTEGFETEKIGSFSLCVLCLPARRFALAGGCSLWFAFSGVHGKDLTTEITENAECVRD
jgi:hypothetical protein